MNALIQRIILQIHLLNILNTGYIIVNLGETLVDKRLVEGLHLITKHQKKLLGHYVGELLAFGFATLRVFRVFFVEETVCQKVRVILGYFLDRFLGLFGG